MDITIRLHLGCATSSICARSIGVHRERKADAAHVALKTEMLQLRLLEKRRKLVRREDADALIDEICGVVLTHLSGMSARCSRDPLIRRSIDAVVHQVRTELAQVCTKLADKRGEPPIDAA